MVNLACLLAQVPTGLWEKIIFKFNSIFGNYAVAIIIVTLIIKILLLPTDYFNKRSSNKMTEVNAKLQPKIDNIKRKYPDKNVQNQKINELYQKEGFNPLGSCLTTIISLAISMTVFFSLFSSLNNMAAYKIVNQYEQLQVAYVQEYAETNNLNISQGNINEIILEITEGNVELKENETREMIIENANLNVKEKYKDVKESFLWIKNVWIADSPMQRSIPSFEKYSTLAKLKFDDTEEGKAKKLEAEKVYNAVMGDLEKEQGVNGYFLLSVITAVTAFLYQYLLTRKKQSKQNADNPQAKSGKTMLFVIPIIMLVFTLSYNSVFSLYIIVGQMFGMATAPLINKLLDKGEKKTATVPTVIDIEPAKEESKENKNTTKRTGNKKSGSKTKKNTNTKGKTIKYPKKTNKGV